MQLPLFRLWRRLSEPGARATEVRRFGGNTSVARAPGCGRAGRRRAARAVGAFAGVTLVSHLLFGLALDYGPPRLRDPEYGKRLSQLRLRVAENPGRPLVVVVGSSRTAMGVRPGVMEGDDGPPATVPDPHRPLVFNVSVAGSGPILQLLTVRRLFADGVRPAAVVLEYWPAFLREDGPYHESGRFAVYRLRPGDKPLVEEFFRDPAKTERDMAKLRYNPVYNHRPSLMNQFLPSWLPNGQRSDAMYAPLDGWGWLPGHPFSNSEKQAAGMAAAAGYYKPVFAQFTVSPDADRALRQTVAECRAAGAAVALVYLPEAAGFRAFMPPAAVRLADEHLAKVRAELKLDVIDCRDWMPDIDLPDGFHLIQPAAATFTRRFVPVLDARYSGHKPGDGRPRALGEP